MLTSWFSISAGKCCLGHNWLKKHNPYCNLLNYDYYFLLMFRYFRCISSALWCVERETESLFQQCICWIRGRPDPHNHCDELVSSCTGDCSYLHSSAWFCRLFSLHFYSCVWHSQPALLYIVPGVVGFVAVHCLWNGEVKPVSSVHHTFWVYFLGVKLYMSWQLSLFFIIFLKIFVMVY